MLLFIFFQLLGRLCWFTSKRNEEISAMEGGGGEFGE